MRIGKQGRVVIPKELREAWGIEAGDEAVIVAKDGELRLRPYKVSRDPLQDLVKLSETVSIGLSAEELKRKADEGRLKDFLER